MRWCGVRGEQGLQILKGSSSRENNDKAGCPIVWWRYGRGVFRKVFLSMASPVEAKDAAVFRFSEITEFTGIATATWTDDGEFGYGEVAGMKGGRMRAVRDDAVFDGEFIKCREAMYQFVESAREVKMKSRSKLVKGDALHKLVGVTVRKLQ
jgi:hypothetical protein